jgi:hypothetical protein
VDWVIVAALYMIGIGFFQLLGGLASAAQAIQRWGHASSVQRARERGLLPPSADGADA